MTINNKIITNFINSKTEDIKKFVDSANKRGQQLRYKKDISSDVSFVMELSYMGKRHKLDVEEGDFMLLFKFTFSKYNKLYYEILRDLWKEYHPNSGSVPYKNVAGQPPYCRIKDGISKSEIDNDLIR